MLLTTFHAHDLIQSSVIHDLNELIYVTAIINTLTRIKNLKQLRKFANFINNKLLTHH